MDELAEASLRRLRLFLAVAETEHMGRAADQLGLAQPALSEQIRRLETGLGVKLFHRRKRGIALTTAGEAYRVAVAKLLAQHHAAAELARRTARGEVGRLAIGYVASAMIGSDFPLMLQRLRTASPDLQLELMEGRIAEICAALEGGDLDVAVVRAPIPLRLDWKHLVATRQPLWVVLPGGHRLVQKESLSIGDLSSEPLIGYSDPDDVGIMKVVLGLATQAGATVNLQLSVSAMTSILGLVSVGLGCGIVPEGLSRLKLDDVCFRPLRDAGAQAELWYVWRAEAASPALDLLLNDARAHAET